jgi:hypothetical protein
VERAREIDREIGNTLWQDAIAKEMKAVRVAFKILEDGNDAPPRVSVHGMSYGF